MPTTTTTKNGKPVRVQTDNGMYIFFLMAVFFAACTSIRTSWRDSYSSYTELRGESTVVALASSTLTKTKTSVGSRDGDSNSDSNSNSDSDSDSKKPKISTIERHETERTQSGTEISNAVVSQNVLNNIDWSDSIFKRRGWDNDPVVIESHKLVFFTVPKNACTTFKKIFRRMMGYPDWFHASPHNPEKNGLRYLGHYDRDQQREFMTSPNWTRAIFVRDPLERTLSAYMDKALHIGPPYWQPPVEGAHLKRMCCNLKGANETAVSRLRRDTKSPSICRKPPLYPYEAPVTEENFPFETFVSELMHRCWDTHWRPQYQRMKPSNWHVINFVGHFETKLEDTHRLLKRLGAFEEYGAEGWGEALNPSTNATRSLSIFETNTALHKTGSAQKMDEHYTETVRKAVLRAFSKDYDLKLFNFTDPTDIAVAAAA